MACYHFTIKTDKKPDGSQVSAITHAEYISREGKYKDHDLKEDLFNQKYKNIIKENNNNNILNGKELILYHSPYGDIVSTGNAVGVSDNASIETIAIALIISQKIYGNEVNLDGNIQFKASTLVAANELNLPIEFTDELLEKNFKQLDEVKHNDRKIGSKTKIRQRDTKSIIKNNIFKSNAESYKRRRIRLKENVQGIHSMYAMSKRRMEIDDGYGINLLLQDRNALRNQKRSPFSNVRWDVSGTRRIAAQKTANLILFNMQKQMDNVFASSHAEYINREAAFKKRGGCIYKNHHLPKWAKDSPKKFFAAADKYEGVGNVRYKEIEFNLPNELNLDQQKELINTFLDNHLKDFYYAYAIHDKIGVMSNGEYNTHVHIMFSERKIDDAEIEKERSANKFFAYPKRNAKTLAEKREGGAKKDRKWEDKNRAEYLTFMRKDFARIQNDLFEKYDINAKVDHRSLDVQKQEALKNGDILLAKLLDRMPEKHIGPTAALRNNNKDVTELKKYRQYKKQYQDLLYATDFTEKAIEEDLVKNSLTKNHDIEKIFKSAQSGYLSDDVSSIKKEILVTLKDVAALNKIVIWNKDATELAKISCMSLDEKETYKYLKNLQEEKSHWIIFKDNLKKPMTYQQNELKAYNELLPELDNKISSINKKINIAKEELAPILKKLDTPSMKAKIQNIRYKILFDDRETRKQLKLANEKLSSLSSKLQLKINNKISESPQVFTASDIYKIIRNSYLALRTKHENDIKTLNKLSTKVISMDRALYMAKDIYSKGAFKKIRKAYRDLEKKETYLEKDKASFSAKKEAFNKISIPAFWNNHTKKLKYNEQKNEINILEKSIIDRENELSFQRKSLDNESDLINSKYNTLTAKTKIGQIALGIYEKNQPIRDKFNNLKSLTNTDLKNLKHIKNQMKGVKKQIYVDKNGNQYKVANPGGSSGKSSHLQIAHSPSVSVIADAILGDEKVTPLVMRSNPKDDEMDKNWQMMTEFEKEEELAKGIYKI